MSVTSDDDDTDTKRREEELRQITDVGRLEQRVDALNLGELILGARDFIACGDSEKMQ